MPQTQSKIRQRLCASCPIALLLLSLTGHVYAAEPYLPQNDAEVLEVLPRSLISDELATLRRRLSNSPDDLDLAVMVARRYLSMGSLESDPRFFGYAQAALKPWWDLETAPPQVLRLRAKLQEKQHRYDAALVDLRALLKQEPENQQAWIELANILRVQGKYEEAWDACDRLAAFGAELPTAVCKVPLQAMTGHADEARIALARLLPKLEQQFPHVVQWAHTMRSKLAYAQGHINEAERYFEDALANDPQDKYIIREYADFLLDQKRDADAFRLVGHHVADNGVLLRGAIAARRVGQHDLAQQWATLLATRFEEIRLRGGRPHGRFESRFEREVNGDAKTALRLALTNWKQQKETRDARNVLEAALDAKNREAAQPVIAFLQKHGTENQILRDLINKLESE